jgi:hypothetical protein
MSTKEKETKVSKEDLRKKLHEKIQSKQIGRMSKDQRQKKVDDFCEKMGMSEKDIKSLAELSETFMKTTKQKQK